jgi:hypothetical protein
MTKKEVWLCSGCGKRFHGLTPCKPKKATVSVEAARRERSLQDPDYSKDHVE